MIPKLHAALYTVRRAIALLTWQRAGDKLGA